MHIGQSCSVAAFRRAVMFKGHNQQEATSLLSSFLVPPVLCQTSLGMGHRHSDLHRIIFPELELCSVSPTSADEPPPTGHMGQKFILFLISYSQSNLTARCTGYFARKLGFYLLISVLT